MQKIYLLLLLLLLQTMTAVVQQQMLLLQCHRVVQMDPRHCQHFSAA